MTTQRPDPYEHAPTHAAPELAPLVADLFVKAQPAQRLRLLNGLLQPVGPLALVAIAAGAFGSLLPPRTQWHGAIATLDDATRFTGGQVLELARYVEQKSPEAIARLPELLGDSPLWVGTLSGALLLLVLRAWRRRQPSSKSPL